MRYRVVKAHKPGSQDVLTMSKGDRLRYERRPTEWEGWLWCAAQSGLAGWVPEAWVRIEGNTCVALRDYVSAELEAEVGQELSGELIESGWALVRSGRGEEGWVPLECLGKVDD